MLALAWRAALLLGAGAALGLGINALRAEGVALSGFQAPVACSAELEGPAYASAVQLVPQHEAASLCADPATQVADARSADAYAEGHIAGAIHLPCSASERTAASALTSFATTRLLLVYGEHTDDAFRVAEELGRRLGPAAPRIGVLEGGFAAWREAGLACASGSCAECGAASDHRHPSDSGP